MEKTLRRLLKALIVLFILMLIFAAGLLFVTEGPLRKNKLYGEDVVRKSKREDFVHYNTSYIYDSEDNLLARISDGEGYGNYIPYKKIPKNVINAFIAVEDRTFWENEGYDPEGIARVIYRYIKSRGSETHGASTITQQIVRMQFLSNEKTLDRKFKEIGIARAMNDKYSKKDIMEFYVNNCYFANGIYGIEMAAKYYFGKTSKDLSLSQCAYLCAIPNRPAYYDPRENPDNAIKRRNKILKNMLECEYISEEDYKKAIKEEIKLVKAKNYTIHDYQTTYAIDCAVKELMDFDFQYHFKSMKAYKKYKKKYDAAYEKAKKDLYTGGYKVYTSLDSTIQNDLQKTVNEEFTNKKKDKEGTYKLQAAMTVIDNESGKVIAVIGGRKQKKFKNDYTYNRAFQSYRQPGSSFKPIAVYTPAIMKAYHADTKVKNIDVSIAKHLNKKEDVEALDGETMTLREAVGKSRNGVAYSVFNDIGVSYGLDFINKMCFSKVVPDDYTLSSALGGLTYGVNTVEMASAYATLINGGVYRPPTCITSIVDYKGKEHYTTKEPKQIYDLYAAQEMLDILKGVITVGTAKDMGWSSPVPAAGKTGTTNDQKDGWFCGVTPFYTASVWVGYDKPKTLEDLYGSTYPADIWKKSMEYLIKDKNYEPPAEEESSAYKDHLSGEKIDDILDDLEESGDLKEAKNLYKEAKEILDSISDEDFLSEKSEDLEKQYKEIKNSLE